MIHKIKTCIYVIAPFIGCANVCAADSSSNNLQIDVNFDVANLYLDSGYNLSVSKPMVLGNLQFTKTNTADIYSGITIVSGDAENGTEYDMYMGFGSSLGQMNYDLNYRTKLYPNQNIDAGEVADLQLGLEYKDLSYEINYNVSSQIANESNRSWSYMAVSANYDDFTLLVGKNNDALLHTDLSYAYNKNLNLTLSIPLSTEERQESGEKAPLDSPFLQAKLTIPVHF